MTEFKDRLHSYRMQLNCSTRTEMAEKIGIGRQLYSFLENGTRQPSKDVLDKLIRHSGLPKEYWLNGITEEEYITQRQELKCLYTAINELKDTNAFDLVDGDWEPEVKELLLAALKADILHLQFKDKIKKGKDL